MYPETQREMVKLIALLANKTGSRIILTTHSPYLLSAINNLLYAAKIGLKAESSTHDKIVARIPEDQWLSTESVSAYFVEKGGIDNIIDQELQNLYFLVR